MRKTIFLLSICCVFGRRATAQQQDLLTLSPPPSPVPTGPYADLNIKGFLPPSLGYPPGDTPHTDTQNKRFRGRLIYGVLGGVAPNANYFIVVQAIGQKYSLDGKIGGATFYENQGFKTRFHSPVVSPDGTKMFFRYGDQFDVGDLASSYLWDLGGQKYFNFGAIGISSQLLWSNNNVDYIEYFQDTPPEENWTAQKGAVQPMVVAAKLGDPVQIPVPVAARTPAWTRQNTVLCTALPKASNGKPDIIEWKPFSKSAQVVAPAAFDPAPSPDGRYLAYFGWPGKTKSDNLAPVFIAPLENALPSQSQPQAKPADFDAQGPFCFVMDRLSGRKFLINTQGKGLLTWSSDSQTLVVIESRNDGPGAHTALLRTIGIGQITGDLPPNVPHQLKEIAQIKGRDFQPLQRATPPWIRVMSSVAHGKEQWLYFDVSEITGLMDFYAQHKRIIAVNVASGEQVVISEMNDPSAHVQGWDFHDDADTGFKATPVIQRPAALNVPAKATKTRTKAKAKAKR